MGVLARLALFLTTGLLGLSGTACAAEAAPAVGNEPVRTVPCPAATCTVTVTPGTVIDLGDAGRMTVTAIDSDTVTTTADGSRVTSTAGGSNTVNDVSYRVASIRDGAATLEFGASGS